MMTSIASLALNWYDYLIFVVTLVFSALIGIYFGCFGNKQSTVTDYLLGGKKMRMIPIAISVAVSHFSGNVLLAAPAELYRYGSGSWMMSLSFIIMGFLGICIYIPVFFKLQLPSTYEYLEKRFDKRTRVLAFIFYITSEILAFPVHVYSPSLAFATASGVSVTVIAPILCIVCVFYTALGGLRSVVWTDLFQFIIIMTSLSIVYAVGLSTSGGFLSVWNTALNGGRLNVLNFNSDFTERDNSWGFIIGGTISGLSTTIVHQTGIQKFLALPKYSYCVWSVACMVLSLITVQAITMFIGLLCYARYKDCDPLSAKIIKKHDQMLPFYVTDVVGWVPGISGLFLAGICSAALSSMSSDLNALSAVIFKDFLCLLVKSEFSEKKAANILKFLTFLIGILCLGLFFVVDKLGDLIYMSFTITAMTKGPLFGLFTLGMIFPKANEKGAFYGTVGGFVSVMALIIPSKIFQLQGLAKYPTKLVSTTGCDILHNLNSSFIANSFAKNNQSSFTFIKNKWQPHPIFRMSFFFHPVIGAVMTVILGILISYITKTDKIVDKNLLSPVVRPCLSKKRGNEHRNDMKRSERENEVNGYELELLTR